jgi:hypothetical protein
MSITGEVPGEGFDGEEVFIDDEDIINEIPLDDEGRYYLHTSTSYLVGSTLLRLLHYPTYPDCQQFGDGILA